jgi:hypothetical protein
MTYVIFSLGASPDVTIDSRVRRCHGRCARAIRSYTLLYEKKGTTMKSMKSTTMMDQMTSMPSMSNMMMAQPAKMNMMMIPRCTFEMEKLKNGMMMRCVAGDEMAAAMMQNLCRMLAGGMMSCHLMMNGMMVLSCNMTMGMCKCEMTTDGICVTCISGDSACAKMMMQMCDCMTTMMEAGCTCCLCMNDTPVCCGCNCE